jgi:hypothetical protein
MCLRLCDGACEVRLSKVALCLYSTTAVRTTHGLHVMCEMLVVVPWGSSHPLA